MEDYPRDVLELSARFSTDEACHEYLSQLRWPDGFVCPRCQGSACWRASRGRIVCNKCRHQTTAIAGTIFQGTHKPLTLWFQAIWHVTCQKNGASAVSVQRALGLGSYLTAWTWLHKLRRAMVRPDRDRLSGRVEIDETFVGGEEANVRGRHTEEKSLVAIAAEEDGRGIARIRLARIPDANRESLHEFIEKVIEPGSTVHTDGLPAYRGLEAKGYTHDVTVLSHQKDKNAASRLLPRVHRVAGLLKRWLLGTHHGAISPEHLDYYLDEFTFRFNRRKSRSRGKLFYRLVQQAVQVDPAPYKSIVGGSENHKI